MIVYRVGPENPQSSFWWNGGVPDATLLDKASELKTWPMPEALNWYRKDGKIWRACCASLEGIREYFSGTSLLEVRDVLGGFIHVFDTEEAIFRTDEHYWLFNTAVSKHVESTRFAGKLF